jgi:hypothetical protein
MSNKLQDVLRVDDTIFSEEFEKVLSLAKEKCEGTKNVKGQLFGCLQLLEECCQRREDLKVTEIKRGYARME